MRILTIGFLCSFCVVTSCDISNEGHNFNKISNDAEIFVYSNKFIEYEAFVTKESKQLKNAIKVLSKSEKETYNRLIKKVTPRITEEEYKRVITEIYKIINIDIDNRLKRLFLARYVCFYGTTFSKVEFLRALQIKNANKGIVATRSSVSELACLDMCNSAYYSSTYSCYSQDSSFAGSPFDEEMNIDPDFLNRIMETKEWAEIRTCLLDAETNFIFCKSQCQ